MPWQKAKDLFTGEMFTEDMDQMMFHYYWKVVGHKHEQKAVICKDSQGRERLVPYDNQVMTRPAAPKAIRKEYLQERPWCDTYSEWPYDEEGHFSFTPWDWTQEPPVPVIPKPKRTWRTIDD